MDISPTAQSANGPASAGRADAEAARKGGTMIGSDFETFLKMLTVQMQNQDPLNPMESTEFATQLAAFSTVEQQVRTNDLLSALGAQMGALSVSQLSGWVGMAARADMPVNFSGSPVTLTVKGDDLADSATLVVSDALGKEVQRLSVSPDRHEMEWAGVTASGAPLPSGTYSLTVESHSRGELISVDPVHVHARIVEARNEDGTPILVMDSGQEVESSDVVGLREPS